MHHRVGMLQYLVHVIANTLDQSQILEILRKLHMNVVALLQIMFVLDFLF